MVFETAMVQLLILTADLCQGGCGLTACLWTGLYCCLEPQLIYAQMYSSKQCLQDIVLILFSWLVASKKKQPKTFLNGKFYC